MKNMTEGHRDTDISFLLRTTEDIIGKRELLDKLAAGKKLRIKYGVDVTAPFLHLGHAVNLWMMRWLQERGHKVDFLIGDFTTQIGDPTGKSKTRKVIEPEAIEANAQEFIRQVSLVLLTDPDVFEVHRNGDWFNKMSLGDFFKLAGRITHGHLVTRKMFQKRIAAGEPIHMHEFLYPVLQGWDSAVLESDLTIVGNDQLFNEMMGRTFQQQEGQDPQAIITTKITPGLCGKEKQSKSLGNFIAITDSPRDKFGKVMSLPDELVSQWFLVYTDVPLETLDQELVLRNPMAAKTNLAAKIVERWHGKEVAEAERKWFKETFSKKSLPESIPQIVVTQSTSLLELLQKCKPESSNGDLRRLLKQGAVKLIDTRNKDHVEHKLALDDLNNTWDLSCASPAVLKIGKRTWIKVRNEQGGEDNE
jgi:tyrosyl-tRNA synthetase